MSEGMMSGKRAAAILIFGLLWLAFTLPGPGHRATAQTVGGAVIINELMYHPAFELEEQEYLELTNTGVMTVNLSGWWFSDGFDYTFPAGTLLPPGGYVVVAREPQAVADQFGLDPKDLFGPFASKRLSNSGERVALRDPSGTLVDEVFYEDDPPWPKAPDGRGASLELINPIFGNERACSWAASDGPGTPGAQNSVYASDIPPCVTGVIHAPVLPTSGQSVVVTAQVDDNGVISSTIVYHKRDEDAGFEATPMVDQGGGTYAAQLPPYPDGALVEFYVEATDEAGLTTRVPPNAPTTTALETGQPVTVGYLFLVQDAPPTPERSLYRLLVTAENWTELTTRDLFSNELLDATFVYRDEVYYNVGFRYRGESSRPYDPKSYRVNFPSNHLFHPDGWGAEEGIKRLNLVSDNIGRETLTHDLFRRAGLAASDTEFVDFYINGAYHALYVAVEQVDEPFLASHLPGDDTGNLYRAKDGGDLHYRGPNPDDYRPYYLKKSNEGTDDFSDVIELTDLLTNVPEQEFRAASESVADMDQWVRWFAINALVFNTEGALFVGQGDDYFLYHRPSDDRFILIPWDHDSTMHQADGDIWAPGLEIVKRILRHPPFTRWYYQNILSLMADEFSEATMHPLIDALPGELDGEKGQLKQFVTDRINNLNNYFASNIPDRTLSITTNGGQSFTTTRQTVLLEGECSPYREVYANGSARGMNYPGIYQWRYTTPPLRPRTNRFVVTDRDIHGALVTTRTITVTFKTFDGGTLTQNLTLTQEAGSYIIVEDIVVPPSLTLSIEPGVTLSFEQDISLFVEGRLLAEGTAQQPITFTRDAESGYWGVVGFYDSRADNRLAHARVEYAGQDSYHGQIFNGVGVYTGQLTLQDSEIHHTSHTALGLVASTADLRRNRVHHIADGAGLRVQGGVVQVEGNIFWDLAGNAPGIHFSGEGGSTGGVVRENLIYGVQGDGIRLDGVILPVERNVIHHCAAAGVALQDAAYWTGTTLLYPTVVNNLIRHNAVGVALRGNSMAHLAHNTLVRNKLAGLTVEDASRATLVNSIVWDSGTPISHTLGTTVTVSYSNLQGGWSGPGTIIDADPQFRNPARADFALKETSPCIDRGTPQGGVPVDLAGIPRPMGEGYDMGALEFFEYYKLYLPFVTTYQ